MKGRILLLLLLLGVFFCGTAVAEESNHILSLREEAASGDAGAMTSLGYSYLNGEGSVERNVDEALKWFNAALDMGYGRAAQSIGFMYYQGNGVERDYEKAYELLSYAVAAEPERYIIRAIMRQMFYEGQPVKRVDDIKAAAEKGDAEAQYKLAQLYQISPEVPRHEQSMDKAVFWAEKAAEQDYVPAQLFLSYVYLGRGPGDVKNFEDHARSLYWLEKAVAQNDNDARLALAYCYLGGDGGVEKDVAKGLELFLQAAENNPEYYALLAFMYYRGEDVPQDYSKAAQYYLLAAENGDKWTLIKLSEMYAKGEGVPQNDKEAYKWLEKASRIFLAESQNKLGYMYWRGYEPIMDKTADAKYLRRFDVITGEGLAAIDILATIYEQDLTVEQDKDAALKWYKLAAQNGSVRSQELLGRMYGIDADYYELPQDYAEAAKWLGMAAAQNDSRALYYLGQQYLKGNGVPQDYVKAYVLTAKAVAGDKYAIEWDVYQYVVRNVLPELMSPAELEKARNLLLNDGIRPEQYL